ncbi:uncharacterized protein [Prorops nasuta]|uniref:uncharacterized protein isoform X2 n=1 Tax=Prorops nasuta TaxID=863751 RepID=UPI0034CE370B
MATNEEQRKEPPDAQEPAHHARRPMNAFLIFCKRHRGSVRSGFPHLENRAVTRVLGEWWATLNPDQKRSYTNLAQEYKDAFLNANPDFKWYKLPAPPLRTLSTRPTNKKSESGINESVLNIKRENSEDDEIINADDDQAIQPGKLADESQIGGLSSLFTPQKSEIKIEQTEVNAEIKVEEGTIPDPPKKKYLEPLSPNNELKKECKADLFGARKRKQCESNNNDSMEVNIENEKQGNKNFPECIASNDESCFRGERTCKGLRYQKFLAEQMRNTGSSGNHQIKQKKLSNAQGSDEHLYTRRNSISSNVSEKTDSISSEGGNSSRGELEHLVEGAEGNIEASKPEDTETEGAEGNLDFVAWTTRKRFRAEDFNLEKKIEALPSLSLEEFQEKKKQQRTKKKKMQQKLGASTSKKYNSDFGKSGQVKSQNKNLEEFEKTLVGSQKRKARKRSITRNAAITDPSKASENSEDNKPWCSSPDLEALACLAAVAADRTKLTKN